MRYVSRAVLGLAVATFFPALAQAVELPPATGEIRLDGTIESVDLEQQSLRLQVTSFTLPNGRSARLAAPKTKVVLVNDQTSVCSTSEARRQGSLLDLKVGAAATVIGTDTGTGRPLPGRIIATVLESPRLQPAVSVAPAGTSPLAAAAPIAATVADQTTNTATAAAGTGAGPGNNPSPVSRAHTYLFRGPIPTRNLDPLNTPFLLPMATDGRVLGKDHTQFGLNFEIANNFVDGVAPGGRAYITDFEEQRLLVTYARGLGNRQEVSVRLPIIARNRGFLDRVVSSYDRLIGQRGSGRDQFPAFRDIFQATDLAGRPIVNQTDAQLGLGDTTLEYRHGLTRTDQTDAHRSLHAVMRGLVKLPTGSSSALLGSGGTDLGLGLALSAQPTRRFALHFNATEVELGHSSITNLQTRRQVGNLVLAGEYLLNRRTSLVVQSDYNALPVRNVFAATQARKSLTMGLWHQSSLGRSYFASFTENKLGPFGHDRTNGTAPDISLSFGMTLNR